MAMKPIIMTIKIKYFNESHIPSILNLMHSCNSIDHHNSYTLWQAAYYDPKLFLCAHDKQQLIGYVFGRSTGSGALLWQICIDKGYRGKGIAKQLVSMFYEQSKKLKLKHIELTISNDNQASKALFHQVAMQLNQPLIIKGDTGTFANTMKSETIYSIAVLD